MNEILYIFGDITDEESGRWMVHFIHQSGMLLVWPALKLLIPLPGKNTSRSRRKTNCERGNSRRILIRWWESTELNSMLKGHASLPKEETILLLLSLIAKEVMPASLLNNLIHNSGFFHLLIIIICLFISDRKDKDSKKRSSKRRKVFTLSFLLYQLSTLLPILINQYKSFFQFELC